MSTKKIVGLLALGLVVLIALGWGLSAMGVLHYSVFAPWTKEVQRNVFEETKSYKHGLIMDLAKYKHEYDSTDDLTEKKAIREIIRQRFAEFDAKDIRPANLRQFLVAMRGY